MWLILYLSCVAFNYRFQFEPTLRCTILHYFVPLTVRHVPQLGTLLSSSLLHQLFLDLFATVTLPSVITVATSVTREPLTCVNHSAS